MRGKDLVRTHTTISMSLDDIKKEFTSLYFWSPMWTCKTKHKIKLNITREAKY